MGPTMQALLVAPIVAGCALYAVWRLLTAGARRRVAGALLRLHPPAALCGPLQRVVDQPSGCACDGCAKRVDETPFTARTKPIVFHPRRR
jgi:hypothetical protein